MRLEHAQRLGSQIIGQLRPYCDKIEIAGSVRRGKPDVKDIEIVCIPKQFQSSAGLLGGDDTYVRADGFVRVVNSWNKVKGDARNGKYMKRSMTLDIPSVYEKSVVIDIFTATPYTWGLIMLIRTGDADFSKKMIGTILPKFGFVSEGGWSRVLMVLYPFLQRRLCLA